VPCSCHGDRSGRKIRRVTTGRRRYQSFHDTSLSLNELRILTFKLVCQIQLTTEFPKPPTFLWHTLEFCCILIFANLLGVRLAWGTQLFFRLGSGGRMLHHAGRSCIALIVILLLGTTSSAQITWNVTYQDVIINNNSGFDSPTLVNGVTLGQLRRDSVTAATQYLNTILDGRGTVNLHFNTSLNQFNGMLASFGPDQLTNINGSFQNGGVYQAARTNIRPFSGEDAGGQFNFAYSWNYANQYTSSSSYDMVTVAIHEIAHGLGFLSFTDSLGRGLNENPVGSPDIYSGFDRYLQRGNGTGGGLFNTTITSPNFGSFTGLASTLTNGNDPTTGLFFGGQYAREVYGGAIPLYAPSSYQPGSSTSHVNDAADVGALMYYSIGPNVVRRFRRYEIAMLMDVGWNVYNWANDNGSWKDGVVGTPGNESFVLSDSKWRTDQGIVFSGWSNGGQQYNTYNHPGQAPVLPPYGQVTSNIVLNFGGSGSSSYTSQNDLGDIRICRLNLNSSSTATNFIINSASNPTGTLIFGVNSDGTSSVLTPKIVQQNSGAFVINVNLAISNTTGAPGGGWTGLTVDGSGSGRVTLGGVISGNGTLTKAGSFTLELTGSSANTYTGLTTVNDGVLLLNKTPQQNAFGGSVTIAGGVLQIGADDQMPETGVVNLAGGTLRVGQTVGVNDTVGKFEMTASSAIELLPSASGSYALTFSGFQDTTLVGTLTITGWTGTLGQPGTSGRILIADVSGNPNTTYASFLSNVKFTGYNDALFIPTAIPGTWELVPVPEPGSVLGVAGLALGLGTAVVRRWKRNAS
jgi:autotransporter-associated beta strand protein